MTVRELIQGSAGNCKNVEVIIRENGAGKWIQGYRVGTDAPIYPFEYRAEEYEKNSYLRNKKTEYLDNGKEADIVTNLSLPMKVISKNVGSIPDYIGDLQVSYYIPRHIYRLHGEALTSNHFDLDIVCYPTGWQPRIEIDEEKENKSSDQMTLF